MYKILSIIITKLENKIKKLEKNKRNINAENIKCNIEIYELKAKVVKLRCNINELKKKSEFKKNCKFQIRCIQIIKEILNKKSIIEYYPSFLNELELNIFFQKYQIT